MIMVIAPNKRHLEEVAKQRAREARAQAVPAVAPMPAQERGSESREAPEAAVASDEG